MKILISFIAIAALIAAGLSIYFYIDQFGIGYFESVGDWGTLGDFFGGILNPTFTFLSIILLAYTLYQNKMALEQNQIALDLNNEELEISSKALTSSAEAQHAQTIGNTFFNLLSQHNNIVNNLLFDNSIIKLGSQYERQRKSTYHGRNVFKALISFITNEYRVKDPDEIVSKYLSIQKKHNHIVGHYFRNLFQIIKYIDEYSDLETDEDETSDVRIAQKKNFMRILRAQLSSDELSLLLINCLPSVVDEGQFRALLIKYEMLKHLSFQSNTDAQKTIFLSDLTISSACFNSYFHQETNQSAFGDNKIALDLRSRTIN